MTNIWIREAGQELSRPCPVIKRTEVSYYPRSYLLLYTVAIARGLTVIITGLMVIKNIRVWLNVDVDNCN